MTRLTHLLRCTPDRQCWLAPSFLSMSLLLLSSFAAPDAMASPGFEITGIDSSEQIVDPKYNQRFSRVKLSTLSRRLPNYTNWDAMLKSVQTPAGIEVTFIDQLAGASGSSSPSNPKCGIDTGKDCYQEHFVTLNAFHCSLKGDYVAVFNVRTMNPVQGPIPSHQESVPFRIESGGECNGWQGEARRTLAELAGPPIQPARNVLLESAEGVCLRQAEGDTITLGPCNTPGSEWRHYNNRLWSTTGDTNRCLSIDNNDGIHQKLSLSKQCSEDMGYVPRSPFHVTTFTFEELKQNRTRIIVGQTDPSAEPRCLLSGARMSPTDLNRAFMCSKAAPYDSWSVQTVVAKSVWQQLPGLANDVGAGGGALWVVGTNPVSGGYGLHRWDGKTFIPASGGAVRIDLDPQGNPWVVNNAGQVFRWTGSAWVGLPGNNAQDIGIGANGTVWMVGGAKVSGGFSVFRWNAAVNKWDAMSGGGVRIDVDPQGNAWMVNDAGQIWHWNGSGWVGVPGKARDIGVGPEGSVFVVGDNGTVHKWNGSTWIARDGVLSEITVGPNGVPVGVNAGKQIWMGYP